jgi:hypothetical protein
VLVLVALYNTLVMRLPADPPPLGAALPLAALVAAGLLGYLRLLAKAYSPALVEARLQALQARIRPHFLFNSLNAVLSLIRRDPKRAERALEDLADVFRTLMSEPRQFVRLADEISLLERYAGIEQLRLGERLRIIWELDAPRSTRCCRRSCCSRCSRTRCSTASSPAPRRARCSCASSGAATGCSPASRIPTSPTSSAA